MTSCKIIKSAPSSCRLHKFPPYRQESDISDVVDEQQPSFEQGYQEGLDQGHQEGYQQGYPNGLVKGEEDGHQKGLAVGLSEGKAQGQILFEQSLQTLATVQEKVEQLSHHKVQAQQALIGDLVTQVARSVIRAELTLNPKQILTLAEEALVSLADDVDKVRIFLNIEDLQRLKALSIETLNGWPLEVDEQLDIGDCLIRSAQMEISVNTEERFTDCMSNVNESISS